MSAAFLVSAGARSSHAPLSLARERFLQALKIERDALKLLFFRATIALAHRHRFFFELRLEIFDLIFPTLQVLSTRRKLLLQAFAGELGRCRFSIDALG